MTWKNILLQVESEASIPLSASLLDKSEKLLDMRLERDVKIIEGVKFALSRLTTPRCICSNSSSHRLDMMLTKVGLKPYFAPHIYSAKDLGADRVKPKPDIFLHGAAQFGVSPIAWSWSKIPCTASMAQRPLACASSALPARPTPIPATPTG